MNLLLNREITEKEGRKTFYTVISFVENTAKDCPRLSNGTFTGVLISPQPDLLPDVFCFMVRIFCLMLVLLHI
jgi:hypothetical protein